MALDGAYLHAVRQELMPLIDARIEKIHQPTREELIVAFRSRTGGAKVLFSCAADRARVHLTQVAVENPKAPPMFCMLLRKRLGNGKLLDIRQDGLERVLYFDFSCVNELGDIVQLTLAMEIMGRYSNLILIDETGKVVDSMKRVDATMSERRTAQLFAGVPGADAGGAFHENGRTFQGAAANFRGRFAGSGAGVGILYRKGTALPGGIPYRRPERPALLYHRAYPGDAGTGRHGLYHRQHP